MKLELRSVKINRQLSEETPCYSAVLYVDGVKAASVSNHGQGGPDDVHWLRPELEQPVEAYCRSQPAISCGYKTDDGEEVTIPFSLESLCGQLLDEYERQAQYKRWCRTAIVFQLQGDKPEEFRTIKPRAGKPWTKAGRQHLVNKYGDKITRILNQELHGDPAA